MPYHVIHGMNGFLARTFNGNIAFLRPLQWLKRLFKTSSWLCNGLTALLRYSFGKGAPSVTQTTVAGYKSTTSTPPASSSQSPTLNSPNCSQTYENSYSWVVRANEEAIKAIPDEAFITLFLETMESSYGIMQQTLTCRIIRRTQGTFNHCVIISVAGHGTFAIKVPFTGTREIWSRGHAHNFRCEVQTMEYIRRNTKVPIPEVIAFDDTLHNVLSAPYILMRGVQGYPSYTIWFGVDSSGKFDVSNMDYPSVTTYKWRVNFLKSLAFTMAELRNLTFDKIGMLNFESDTADDSPTVGPYYTDYGDGLLLKTKPYSSSKDYYSCKVKIVKPDSIEDEDEVSYMMNGTAALFQSVYETAPFKHPENSPKETFVLAHPDLDFQNIYTDRQGNVVGIIDWDMTRTVPRYVGYASLPLFLRKDFETFYDMGKTHPPWVLDHYRDLYSNYMLEALSDGTENTAGCDAVYTRKSGLYHAAFAAIGVHEPNTMAFIELLFKAIPALWAVDKFDLMKKLGGKRGWSGAQSMLKRELPRLFQPYPSM